MKKAPYPKTEKEWLEVFKNLKKTIPKDKQEGMFLVLPLKLSTKKLFKKYMGDGFEWTDKAFKNGKVINFND